MANTKGAVRAALVLMVSSLVTGGLLVGRPAAGATVTVSDEPSPSYQTNGRVDAIVTVGTTVYIGGNFTVVRPAGSPPGTDTVPRERLAAFSTVTGALLPWNPGANSTVNALAASPDGRTIYVGGRFGRLGDEARHNLGAVRAGSGKIKGFRADTDRRVLALAATKKRVFVGGKLTKVDGIPRSRLAALTARGRVVRKWRSGPDGFVRALALSKNRKSLFVGGDFNLVAGKKQRHLAKVTVKRGQVRAFHRHPRYPVVQLAVTRHRVYLAGNGAGGHAAAYTNQGDFRWVRQLDGAVHSIASLNGVLYVGGQFANVCVGNTGHPTTGFDCPTVLSPRRHLAAFATSDGAVLPWDPGANSIDGVFAVARVTGGIQIGGDFTTVHDVEQQSYGVFAALP
jgi:hypothetical protein